LRLEHLKRKREDREASAKWKRKREDAKTPKILWVERGLCGT
jgi:hypothetical protein